MINKNFISESYYYGIRKVPVAPKICYTISDPLHFQSSVRSLRYNTVKPTSVSPSTR